LIGDAFEFYHTGLFLMDASGEWAELRAASSAGGRKMLARGYRLRVSDQSVIGQVAELGTSHIVLDEGEQAATFNNPNLPDTRSEAVLPLRARGETIGVLDVQSREPDAFSEEDMATLQMMADQIAVAINNALLIQQAQDATEAERRVRGDMELEGWRQLLRSHPDLAFRSTERATVSAPRTWHPEMEQAWRAAKPVVGGEGDTRLAIPIEVGGHVIGVVEGRKARMEGEWTDEERLLLQSLTDQLNAAVERARLYQETQRRAARERTVAETTSRMREPVELDQVLRIAAQEMRRALDLDTLAIQLKSPEMRERSMPNASAANDGGEA
jgi:GAF domain-containing protein